jgi:cytochrome P450
MTECPVHHVEGPAASAGVAGPIADAHVERNANQAGLPEIRPNVNGLEFDPTLAQALELAPVTRINLPYGQDAPWLVSRAADIRKVTADRRFSRSPLVEEVPIARLMPSFVPPPSVVQRQDDPKVSDMREAMGAGLTYRRMRQFRPVADRIVSRLLDSVVDETEPVDLFETFTGRLPLTVMADLIGIPEEDCEDIRRWTRYLFSTRESERELTEEAEHALGAYAAGLVQARIHQPGNDLLSRMIADRGQSFDFGEFVGMTIQLICIGIAPSNALLSNIFFLLLTDQRLAAIREDPAQVGLCFDELCRFAPVIQGFGPPIVATTDVEIGGVQIKSGDAVVYSYTSGNRDPEEFERPDQLDLSRRNVNHFTFGSGIHACVAEHFSRLIVTSAVHAFFTRYPDATLTAPHEVDWDNGTIWRFPVALPVALRGQGSSRALVAETGATVE